MVDKEFRDKVFDQELLSFCLTLFDFNDRIPGQSAVLRRVILNALAESASIKEVTVFLTSINALPGEMSALHLGPLLDFCGALRGQGKERLEDFLMTVRHLAANPSFKDWGGFFDALKILANEGIEASDEFFMTVRHLAAGDSFREWEAFFHSVKTLPKNDFKKMAKFFVAVRHALGYFKNPDSLKSIFKTLALYPQYSEACAYGQLDSKQWLVDEARRAWSDSWGTVFVLAGWVGFLPRFIFDAGISLTRVRSFDVDPEVGAIAEMLNQTYVQCDWQFKSSTMDISDLRYPSTFAVHRRDGTLCELSEIPDLVINTSCEHIADIESWWAQVPRGTRVILQSNDGFQIPGHVRCFKSLSEFEAAMKLTTVVYRGEKPLPEFRRFMLIGVK